MSVASQPALAARALATRREERRAAGVACGAHALHDGYTDLILVMLPQVFGRFIGFATYQLDSNLRNSTMVGIVGAGGIGGTLFAAFQRFDYDYVCAILISIIALIMVGELLATAIRAIFIENATFGDLFRRGAATRRARHVEAD